MPIVRSVRNKVALLAAFGVGPFLRTPVPEPATMLLCAAPLLVVAGAARRRPHLAP